MYFVYILRSLKTSKHYIGSCEVVELRFKQHNSGKVKATKSGIPWVIIRLEKFTTRPEAVKREKQIKSYKGGEAFKRLIKK